MSKKTLNKANLLALGAEQLTDLLLEVSTGSADIKRRLRLELCHHLGVVELGREVRKRLVSLHKSKSYVSWRKRKALVKDLQTQADMICDKIAADDPALGFDLLWDFVALAPSIYERVDDSRGDVGDVFRAARDRFEDITPRANLVPEALADRIWDVIQDNGYGEFDGLIDLLGPSLGDVGLDYLRELVTTYRDAPMTQASEDHEALVFLRSLRSGDSPRADEKTRRVKGWLQEIAAAKGDADAYVAQYSADDLMRPIVAAEVAQLWLTAGQEGEALALLEAAEFDGRTLGQEAWDAAYIRSLIQIGRSDAALAHRWKRFEQTLSVAHLRAYLKELPDFEDIEAEDSAKAYARSFPRIDEALGFLLEWPDHEGAAQLIEARSGDLDGDMYWLFTLGADALRVRYPLASVLLLRSMIDYTLELGRSSRYGHASEHLMDCATLDGEIADYGTFASHQEYVENLEQRHDRKTSFWKRLK